MQNDLTSLNHVLPSAALALRPEADVPLTPTVSRSGRLHRQRKVDVGSV